MRFPVKNRFTGKVQFTAEMAITPGQIRFLTSSSALVGRKNAKAAAMNQAVQMDATDPVWSQMEQILRMNGPGKRIAADRHGTDAVSD